MTPKTFIILAALIVNGCTTNEPKPEAQQPKPETYAAPPTFEFYTIEPQKQRPPRP